MRLALCLAPRKSLSLDGSYDIPNPQLSRNRNNPGLIRGRKQSLSSNTESNTQTSPQKVASENLSSYTVGPGVKNSRKPMKKPPAREVTDPKADAYPSDDINKTPPPNTFELPNIAPWKRMRKPSPPTFPWSPYLSSRQPHPSPSTESAAVPQAVDKLEPVAKLPPINDNSVKPHINTTPRLVMRHNHQPCPVHRTFRVIPPISSSPMPYSPVLVDHERGIRWTVPDGPVGTVEAYVQPRYFSPACPFTTVCGPDVDSRSVVPYGQLCPMKTQSANLDTRGAIPGLNTVHREVMDVHHEQLLDVIEPRQMTCALLGLGAIGDFHCSQLNLMYPEGNRAVNRLLLEFLRKQGTAGFIALVSALKRCFQDKMANALMKTEGEVCDLFFHRTEAQQREVVSSLDSKLSDDLDDLEQRVAALEEKTMITKRKKKQKRVREESSSDDQEIADLENRVAVLGRLARNRRESSAPDATPANRDVRSIKQRIESLENLLKNSPSPGDQGKTGGKGSKGRKSSDVKNSEAGAGSKSHPTDEENVSSNALAIEDSPVDVNCSHADVLVVRPKKLNKKYGARNDSKDVGPRSGAGASNTVRNSGDAAANVSAHAMKPHKKPIRRGAPTTRATRLEYKVANLESHVRGLGYSVQGGPDDGHMDRTLWDRIAFLEDLAESLSLPESAAGLLCCRQGKQHPRRGSSQYKRSSSEQPQSLEMKVARLERILLQVKQSKHTQARRVLNLHRADGSCTREDSHRSGSDEENEQPYEMEGVFLTEAEGYNMNNNSCRSGESRKEKAAKARIRELEQKILALESKEAKNPPPSQTSSRTLEERIVSLESQVKPADHRPVVCNTTNTSLSDSVEDRIRFLEQLAILQIKQERQRMDDRVTFSESERRVSFSESERLDKLEERLNNMDKALKNAKSPADPPKNLNERVSFLEGCLHAVIQQQPASYHEDKFEPLGHNVNAACAYQHQQRLDTPVSLQLSVSHDRLFDRFHGSSEADAELSRVRDRAARLDDVISRLERRVNLNEERILNAEEQIIFSQSSRHANYFPDISSPVSFLMPSPVQPRHRNPQPHPTIQEIKDPPASTTPSVQASPELHHPQTHPDTPHSKHRKKPLGCFPIISTGYKKKPDTLAAKGSLLSLCQNLSLKSREAATTSSTHKESAFARPPQHPAVPRVLERLDVSNTKLRQSAPP